MVNLCEMSLFLSVATEKWADPVLSVICSDWKVQWHHTRLFISVTAHSNTVATNNDFLSPVHCTLPNSFYFKHANETLT